jgi:hypothetical protein
MSALLKQCRDALAKAIMHIDELEGHMPVGSPSEYELYEESLRIGEQLSKDLAAIDAELARTDGPSDEQVDAALEAYNGAPGKMTEVTAGGMRRAMKRALYVAGVRAPRVVVPSSGYNDDTVTYHYDADEILTAIRTAGCVPVDQQGNEIQ